MKALLISLGVTAVSLTAVVVYVVTASLEQAYRGGAVVTGGVGSLLLKLSLIELPAVFLLALLLLRRKGAAPAQPTP